MQVALTQHTRCILGPFKLAASDSSQRVKPKDTSEETGTERDTRVHAALGF